MTDEGQTPPIIDPEDELGAGLGILSFCIPIAGAVIYFSNKDTKPQKAKSACYLALAGVGVGIVLNIIGTMAGAGY